MLLSVDPGSMMMATSWCTHDHRGRHPSPVDSLHASGSFELRAHQQAAESDRSLSGSHLPLGLNRLYDDLV
jgi:hypothetical protein